MNRKIKLALSALLLVAVSSLAFADQVTNDDQIVLGSLCIGLDCVNGEGFGFDTVRLKENNTRLRFFDTSNSGSFPTTDWQLTANDSSNGGGRYFAIEELDAATIPFRVEAGAGNDALYVGAGGQVGVGTSMPESSLHVRVDNTPALRLEQDGTGGFSPQTWDAGGNETSFFVRDTTAATTPLLVRPAAPDGSLVVEANGNLTIAGTLAEGSSRTIKHDIRPVDRQQVLEAVTQLDIARWRYRRDDSGAEHIGPMAEDFHARFQLGQDDAHISTLDTAGVALASIQALNDRLVAQNRALEEDNARIRARLARLEAALEKLDER